MVSKGEEQEQQLYSRVRAAEYDRQKQEQAVRRLQTQLAELKRRNAVVVKQTLVERNQEEEELEQALIREKAELDKVGVIVFNQVNRGGNLCLLFCTIFYYVPLHYILYHLLVVSKYVRFDCCQ